MATLLFLGASISQVQAIRRARELGHRSVAVDGDPNAVAFPLCDVAVPIDFSDVDRVAEVGAQHRVAGVVAISTDRAVVPAARVAARLGLPGIGEETALRMTDKTAMRAALAAAGVPQPRHRAAATAVEAAAAAAEIGFPAVVKPSDSGGQRGVYLVHTADEAREAAVGALRFARNGLVLVEEYVAGTELNGIFVVRGGEPTLISFSDRLRPPGPGFGVGWIHSYPSSLPPRGIGEARRVAERAIAALGLRDGIAFPQLIVAAVEARLVEAAARIPAGQMADLVRFATGIDLHDVAFALALGETIPDTAIAHRFTRPVAIRFLTASPGVLPVGRITRLDGIEKVRAADGVLAADLYVGVGSTIAPVQVDADRSGYVVATAASPAAALALADAAAARLTVRAVPAGRRPRPVRLAALAVVLLAAAVIVVALLFADDDSHHRRALGSPAVAAAAPRSLSR